MPRTAPLPVLGNSPPFWTVFQAECKASRRLRWPIALGAVVELRNTTEELGLYVAGGQQT